MGRRKIEIQPIREERNRTVTFIKRKAGLFKKAHELAVLCQVDVAVLILGSNNTFYEFSSVDMQNMIEYYQRDDLAHDVKGPSDFGAYQRKSHITLNKHAGRKSRKGYYGAGSSGQQRQGMAEQQEDENGEEEAEDEEEEDAEDSDRREDRRAGSREPSVTAGARLTRSALKREQQQQQSEAKKQKIDAQLPKFNPLQQMVQRQFQNLYKAASNPPSQAGSSMLGNSPAVPESAARAEISYSSGSLDTSTKVPEAAGVTALQNAVPVGSTPSSRINSQVDSKRRPVLRVQIPSSNTSYNPAIQSASSSSSSVGATNANASVAGLVSRNSSAVRYDLPANQQTPKRQTPPAGAIQGSDIGAKYLMPDKNDPNRLSAKPPSGNSFGLPPMFSASPAYPPYLATPLQASGIGGHSANIHGPPYPMLKQLQMSQQYVQQHHQHQGQANLPAQTPRNPVRASTPPPGDHSAGPLTGSLPSKFAHDLMVPSPNTTMSMFQDWTIGPGTAKAPPSIPSNPVPGSEIPASTYNNGSTGLTPYMMVNQTPLVNRFFSFSSDATDDKNHGNTDVLSNSKGP
ncbi:hypothetical protein HG536_0A06650 [Torulaspora globosa]|uniref:MADS-box domain-containing protein n=1 Tax=Torulaspora globosa TaxID=48254 RepID=A0A7G3ZBG4_9SACH|nr:uncharacterized protein HG536_0A06650 [Torulaspora globosa]QLL30850.1 hypothetical protein HG536_0A06650 [Torulaspora globosa]